MHIYIDTIPHAEQRYPTVGDYWYPFRDQQSIAGQATIEIRVSELPSQDFEFLVALHEMVESYLCYKRTISEESITAFDRRFEEDRAAGKHSEEEEPGDDFHAPYYKEHKFATKLERLMAEELGVNWGEYEAAIIAL